MSVTLTAPQPRSRLTRDTRPDIQLPNGKKLQPRFRFAEELGLSERTVKRMNLATTYIGNVAYVETEASLLVIADTLKRRNQPQRRRRV
jgi:hypothetical protein